MIKALMWTSTNHSPMHYGAQEALHGKHKEALCHCSNTVVVKCINTIPLNRWNHKITHLDLFSCFIKNGSVKRLPGNLLHRLLELTLHIFPCTLRPEGQLVYKPTNQSWVISSYSCVESNSLCLKGFKSTRLTQSIK